MNRLFLKELMPNFSVLSMEEFVVPLDKAVSEAVFMIGRLPFGLCKLFVVMLVDCVDVDGFDTGVVSVAVTLLWLVMFSCFLGATGEGCFALVSSILVTGVSAHRTVEGSGRCIGESKSVNQWW